MPNLSLLLVIDDDNIVRRLVADILTEEGYKVVQASGGEEGLAALAAAEPALILLDLQMPVMRGEAFLRHLRERGSHVPVIIMSDQHNRARQFEEISPVDYLAKPFDVTELLDTVAKYQQ
jgi:CheY-like chemotaxis protein